MSIIDILKLPQVKDGISFGSIALVILLSMIQVSKIPWNPWSEGKLDDHIAESEQKELMDMRRDILDFCNACMNHRKHTKEQFRFVIKECDAYEKYIEDKHVKNGEITAAVKEIRRLFEKCIQENSFLEETD